MGGTQVIPYCLAGCTSARKRQGKSRHPTTAPNIPPRILYYKTGVTEVADGALEMKLPEYLAAMRVDIMRRKSVQTSQNLRRELSKEKSVAGNLPWGKVPCPGAVSPALNHARPCHQQF